MKVKTKVIKGETWYKFNSDLDKWKYFWGNTIAVIFLIVLICLGWYLASLILDNMDELKSNPYLYGANHMRGGGLVECECVHYKGNGMPLPFKFNNTQWTAIRSQESIFDRYKRTYG